MALRPDVNNPVFGYFVTESAEIVVNYCTALLRRHNQSFVCLIHASSKFEKDGSVQELHLSINLPLIIDPQLHDEMLADILVNHMALCHEPEAYENIEGSGWSLIPNTIRYWFKVYMCQPNRGADPNGDNVTHNDDDDNQAQQDDDPMDTSNRREYNYLLYAILEHYARKIQLPVPRQKFLRIETLETYNRQYGWGFPEGDLTLKVDLQHVAEYHTGLGFLNIRIFSMRGNILYATRLSPDIDEWIDLYLNSANIIAYVRNLWSLYKKKYNRMFCMTCLKWVKKDGHTCQKVLLTSKTDEVFIPDVPPERHALVAYADFESYILYGTHHRVSGWGCVVVDRDHEIYDSHYMNVTAGVNDILKNFVEFLTDVCVEFGTSGPMPTAEDTTCGICDQYISPLDQNVTIGRNFINGKSGFHHNACWDHPKNTMYVMFHNFRGYDCHFLILKLVEHVKIEFMSATSMEKFNCITINGWKDDYGEAMTYPYIKITFKDTYNFFTCSLAKCVSMIEDWRYTPEEGRNDKGIFPYTWFDSRDKLMATSLPEGPWHNDLTNTDIDPAPAFKIWEKKKFTYFYEYHDYYMMLDVIQLCDAFEEFRRTCVAEFDTDPVHFQGAPGLTWYLCLCQNPKLFKIIKDKGVYMDIQHNIRGGVSQAMMRYVNIENKPNESMFFLDVNSLYSKCMTYKMPGKYLYPLSALPDNWRELYNADSDLTAFIVCDLVYPEHLHDRDFAYPLAPHHYNDRLCTTFKRRDQYMVHAELLAFYLDRGLILEDVHYLYVFEQDYTLRDYVQNNIEKRRHTNSEVMKTLYKLLNNSLYGKTCENVNKYRKFKVLEDESLTRDDDDVTNPCNAELAECWNIIHCGDQMLVEAPVKEVRLNKPIQIGFAILEFAKREIYQLLAIIADHFGDSVIPLYTDTDSLLFWCDFPEPWKRFYDSPLRPLLDFEKVPEHWGVKTFDTDKQSGLWSPEAGGKEIVEYVGLRAKCYAYRFRDDSVVLKNKGVPKSAQIADYDENPIERITIDHYRSALFDKKDHYVTQYAIRSFQHDVITIKEYKLGISANDLKRSVTANPAISLPFGYRGQKFIDLVTDAHDDSHLDD